MKMLFRNRRFLRSRRRFFGWLGAVALLPWLPGRRPADGLSLKEASYYRKHDDRSV